MKNLSVAKFGGSLLDPNGENIPTILERIREIKNRDDLGPIVVFSAPKGYTDELSRVGESYAQSRPIPIDDIFTSYERIGKTYTSEQNYEQLLVQLMKYRRETDEALATINKRFHGNAKAKVLTSGGELPTSVLMEYIIKANNLRSCCLTKENWPIVTDDSFESATPLYDESKKKIIHLIKSLEDGKIVTQAGFLGVTGDGLETALGRGGSDLTAVFLSCLLKNRYHVETLLFKELPVLSADPYITKKQNPKHVTSLTYNEAHKASMMGMKIVQGAAISMAMRFKQPLKIAPLDNPTRFTIVHHESVTNETVKCVTGKTGCAILSMRDERSRSFENSLRIWEKRNDFLDLGTEPLGTGERIRDFLFLDSEFIRKNEDRLRGFDENLTIEYGMGVVTLIGDKMKDSPGVASRAIGAVPEINIKRGILAPHTSQIILVVKEKDVSATVEAIHRQRDKMNRPV